MRKLLAWFGITTLCVLTSRAEAANDVLKPYVVLILDTSGSMLISTGSGPTSCGKQDNRINHAVCAINNIVNSYGDMVFSLGRFRETTNGSGTPGSQVCDANGDQEGNPSLTLPTPNGGDVCETQGPFCGDCDPSSGQPRTCTFDSQCNSGDCGANGRCVDTGVFACTTNDRSFEVLTPLVDGNNTAAAEYTNGTCNTCGVSATGSLEPEIWGVAGSTFTPLSATLNGAKRYWQGNQATDNTVIWPSNLEGFDPINRDPSNAVFLPPAGQTTCNPAANCVGATCCQSQCRPYITILLTDGDETCTAFTNTVASTSALLNTQPRSDQVSITTAQRTSGIVTLTVAAGHPFKVGDTVVVANATSTGTFVLTAVTATTLTYTHAGANGSTSGGNVRHASANNRYRIETKPIGFGIAPGDPEIEAIAHAGGAIDLPNVNEGYYAQDEADLELAISQILADSVRSEACNNLDDDCDTLIDEDFPNKGGACDNGQLGVCRQTGTLACRADGTGLQCSAGPVTPGTDGPNCNGLDDDCDGRIDENLGCTPCPAVGETCNGMDDDCDGNTDENLVRDCANTVPGVGSCPGTQQCIGANTWSQCSGQTPTAEDCDGVDDDCDGVCDGITVDCSDIVTAGGPATDNPGHPSNNPIPQNICRPGQKTCEAGCGPGKAFGFCSGEVKPCNGTLPCNPNSPASDPCNGLDDDCDNKVDELFVPEDCSTNCGVGQTVCTNGVISCNSTPATNDPTCNNVDDDCDGRFDEDWICANPVNGLCPCGQGQVCEGNEECVNGQVTCVGDPIGVEICNCQDENCNGIPDDGAQCPNGSTCTNCQCAFPCAPGEFPCPLGKKCENQYCVNDPCFQVSCPPVNGNVQTCVPKPGSPTEPQCVDTCSTVTCTGNLICYGPTGDCRPNNCSTFPEMCTENQACVNGVCVSNPCQGVTCESGKYCVGGNCVSSCSDVTCPTGQRCRQGMCETDPCGEPCPFGQACNDNTGQCIEDPCKFRNCPEGQWCNPNDGQCEDDPCVSSDVQCPNEGEKCLGGTCVSEDSLQPDAANEAHVTVGGGGGCNTTGGTSSVLFIGLALLALRRRRVSVATREGGVQ